MQHTVCLKYRLFRSAYEGTPSQTGKVRDGFALRASVSLFGSLEEIALPALPILEACGGNQVHETICDL